MFITENFSQYYRMGWLIFLGNCPPANWVFKILKHASRQIIGMRPTELCRPNFKSFKILPPSCLYIFGLAVFVKQKVSFSYNKIPETSTIIKPNKPQKITELNPFNVGSKIYNAIAILKSTKKFKNEFLLSHCCYSVIKFINKL